MLQNRKSTSDFEITLCRTNRKSPNGKRVGRDNSDHTKAFRVFLSDTNYRILGACLIRSEPYAAPYTIISWLPLENGCSCASRAENQSLDKNLSTYYGKSCHIHVTIIIFGQNHDDNIPKTPNISPKHPIF